MNFKKTKNLQNSSSHKEKLFKAVTKGTLLWITQNGQKFVKNKITFRMVWNYLDLSDIWTLGSGT